MSITPSLGRRGTFPLDSTSPTREEAIRRPWTFLVGLVASALRIYGGSPTAGALLAASDAAGNTTWTRTLPAVTFTDAAETANQTGTIVPVAVGEYIVTVYSEVVTAGAAGTLYSSITYTDDIGATTIFPLASLNCASTGRDYGVAVIRCAGGGIDYTFEIVGGSGSPAYSAYVSVTQVR